MHHQSEDMEDIIEIKRFRQYKASAITNGLGLSKSDLRHFLNRQNDYQDFHLSSDQLQYIQQLYVRSIHREFDDLIKTSSYGSYSKETLKNYYSSLVYTKHGLVPKDISIWELDDSRIIERFYALINKSTHIKGIWSFQRSILRTLLKAFKQPPVFVSNKIHSIISPRLFFNYVDEDDVNAAANLRIGFVVVSN